MVAGETVAFVFDINVVRKGPAGGYNLLPVISGSGVAGRDVDVDEVGDGGPDSEEDSDTDEEEAEESPAGDGDDDDQGGGPPDDVETDA